MIWLYIILGIIAGIIILLISYIKIQIEIKVTSIHTKLRIEVVYVFGLKKSQKEYYIDVDNVLTFIESIPKKDAHEDQEKTNQEKSRFFDKLLSFKEDLNSLYDFLKKTKVDEFTWESTIGLQDADKTGLFSGSLWALKGMIISVLSNITRVKKFRINITPNFNGYEINSYFKCILRIRIVHIIRISIERWLWKIRGYYHGIGSSGKANQSSHRRFDENCYG